MSEMVRHRNSDNNKFQIKILAGIFLMLFSFLLYLIGLYQSILIYPYFVENYTEDNYILLIHPFIIGSAFILGIAVYIFAITRRDLLLMLSLILMGIYLWNTNSLIVPIARVYDTYWHFHLSNLILDSGRFTSDDLLWGSRFYLNYPLTAIFGAEFALFTNLNNTNIIYIFPLIFTSILIISLYATTGLFFNNSLSTRAVVVLVFIIGNASLQTHFSPQTLGLIIFAFLFYLMFNYFKKPDLKIRIMLILFIFITIILHPLTSFVFGLILIALIFNDYAFKIKSISTSVVLLFFIFFFAWQIFWAVLTSTMFFKQLSLTINIILTEGLFSTGGTEHFIKPSYFDPVFFLYRLIIHSLFLVLAVIGLIALLYFDRKKWFLLLSFIVGPFLYFIFTYFNYSSYFHERTIMLMYFPLSIAVGYVIFQFGLKRELKGDIFSKTNFLKKINLQKIAIILSARRKIFRNVLMIFLIISATISIPIFVLVEKPNIVTTQDMEGAVFISRYNNGTMLVYQTNALIYFHNASANILENPFYAWTYWNEAHKSVSEREVETKPSIKYVVLTEKLIDTDFNYDQIRMNLDSDTTMNKVYDNGKIEVYT